MPISKLGFKRLYRLVEHMESLPKSANKHFSMDWYIGHVGTDHQHEKTTKPTVKDLHACGTSACALGWAMTAPSFRRAGLTIEEHGWGITVENSVEVFGLPDESEGLDDIYSPDYWGRLFGDGNKDKTPKAWARRVRKLLKRWEASNVR